MSSKPAACPLVTSEAIRYCKIERMLRRGRTVSFEAMRGSLLVSPATLKRDLHFLREELGAPIHYDVVERGYRLVDRWVGVAATIFEQLETA